MKKALSTWQLSLLATLLMGLAMLVAKLTVAAPLAPEMLFNITGQVLGVPVVFNLIHSLPAGLDQYAKFFLLGTTVVIYLAFWFALGLFYKRLIKTTNSWLYLTSFSLISILLMGLILMPLQRLGLFGLSNNNFFYPPLASHLWAGLFGFIYALVFSITKETSARTVDTSRRETLKLILAGFATLTALNSLAKFILDGFAQAQEQVTGLLQKINGLSPEITATQDHYVVSKNVFNPEVKEQNWKLKLTGLVTKELELSLDDLKALPSVERVSTLICISNQVGGDLMGSSVWTGVRLKDVLELTGVQDNANELILRAADNYSDSFTLDAALREGTIIAYLQNGEPLSKDHGFPARVLVPGIYGMKNVKWVTEIELDDSDYQGYWQSRGWSDSAVVQTMSRIDTRQATLFDNGMAAIGGVAFAGLRGISNVEISLDNGESWQNARVKPALNNLSWNLWGFEWQAEPGNYEVLVRATDGLGEQQTAEKNRPLPDGATGYHRLKVSV